MTTWRYLAQRALTGQWLDWDLPVARDELTWALSGPGSLRGTLPPDYGRPLGVDGRPVLDEWATFLYAEADGIIRWGGILTGCTFDNASWHLDAAGFSTYPTGLPYLDAYRQTGVDPAQVIRDIWRHIQAQPDGNLGITVDALTTPVRLGTTAEPFDLAWWEAPDCGQTIDTLAKQTPLDYVEEHTWSGPSTVAHRIRLGYPRLGRRRTDLAFIQGDNIITTVAAALDGSLIANEGIGIGKGEGRATLMRRIPTRDGRLRRALTYTDKTVNTTSMLDSLVRRELAAHADPLTVDTIEIINHPHAPIGSWQLGDDILVQADVPGLGPISTWSRVVGWSLTGADRAVLTLKPSSSFTYGAVPS